jgi:PAS domain S-box-containing protein
MIVSPSQWLRFWDRLSEPTPDISTPEQRRKARTLASLLLILMPLVLVDFTTAFATQRSYLSFGFVLPLLLVAYFLSRTRFYRAGGLIAVIILFLLPVISLLTSTDVWVMDAFFILKYPLLNIVVGYFVFPRVAFVLLLLIFAGGLSVNVLIETTATLGILLSTDLFLTALALLTVLSFVQHGDRCERQQVEPLIRQSEERYRILSSLVSDYVYAARIGRDQTITTEWMAGAVEAITGYPAEEARTLHWTQFVYPDDIPIFQSRWDRLQQGLVDISEYRIVKKSGEVRWLRDYGYGVTDTDEQRVVFHYGAAQDVTERKLADLALRESEARSRAISESNVVAIIIVRVADDAILYCNERAAALAGTTVERLVGSNISDLAPDLDDFRRYISIVEEKGFIPNSERRLKRLDGEIRYVDASVRTMVLDGEAIRLSALIDITERKAAQEALEQSRARYETLVNSIDGVVWEAETESRAMTFVSRQVERLLGYPTACYYADPNFWCERIHIEDREQAIQIADKAISAGRSFQQQYRMIGADGRIIWVHDIVTIVVEDGYPMRMRGLAINITASKEAQAAELEQRRLAEALRQTTATISTTLDLNEVLDRILTQLSIIAPIKSVDIMLIENGLAHIVRSMGYGEYEAELRKVYLPVDSTPNLRKMVETGRPLVIHDTREFEDWVDIEASRWMRSVISTPIRLEGQTIGFLNMTSEVPNQFTVEHAQQLQAFADQVAIAIRNARLYEQVRQNAVALESLVQERTAELDVERRRIQIILDATGEGVFYTEGLVIRYANDALYRVTGYQQDELIGQPGITLFKEEVSSLERRRLHSVINQLRRDKIWRGELRLRRKDGSPFDAGLTISLVGEAEDKPLRAVTIVRDISKEKVLQAQRSRFVAHASHELRTPITNLKTRLYLLRRRPDDLEYHLSILDEVTDRMKKLVEDLLDISRLERGIIPLKRERLLVQPLLERIVQVQQPEAERKEQRLMLQAPSTPLYVSGDAERLTQVITNLLTNAINYTPANGSICVRVETDTPGRTVLIQVQDTGIGINHDNLPHIFQPFFRVVSEVEGTGLGLSIAKEIVELHDGTIDVQSCFGVGSTFTVRLGLLPQPTALSAS